MATRTIAAGGGNFNANATWDEGVAPVAGDDIVARGDGTSGNVTVTASTPNCSYTFTNYSGTWTINNACNCNFINSTNYALTLSSTMTLAVVGTGKWLQAGTANLTANGKTFNVPIAFIAGTINLIDAWTFSSNITGTGTTTISGGSITMSGGSISTAGTFFSSGVSNSPLTLTGNCSIGGGVMSFASITFNSAGTITVVSFSSAVNTTFTYTAGTITSAGTTITLNGGAGQAPTFTGWTGSSSQLLNNISLTTGTKTVTLGSNLLINGTLTLSSAITFSGAYNITAAAVTFSGAATHTLSGNITCTGTCTVNTGAAVLNGSSYTLNIGGAFTLTAQPISGTAKIVHNGTGTWTCSTSAAYVGNNFEINTAGTFTISGTCYYRTGIFKWTAGTITSTSSTVTLQASCTLTGWNGTTSQRLNNLSTSAAATVTLSNDTYLKGTLTSAGGTLTLNSANVYVSGGLTLTAAAMTGSGGIIMEGTGTISSSSSAGILKLPLTINTAGTITFGTNIYADYDATYSTTSGRWVYTAGTLVTTGSTLTSSVLYFNGWTSGGSLLNITTNGNGTFYLLSNLTLTGTFTHNYAGAQVIDGAYTLTAANLTLINELSWKNGADMSVSGTLTASNTNSAISVQSAGTTLTAANLVINSGSRLTLLYNTGYQDVTLNITGLITVDGDKAATTTLRGYNQSLGAGRTQYLNYSGTLANCQIYELTMSSIDASGSAVPIYSWYGSATSCTNAYAVTGADIDLTPGGSTSAGVTLVSF